MLWTAFAVFALVAVVATADIRVISTSSTTMEWSLDAVLKPGIKYSVEVFLDSGRDRVSIIDEPIDSDRESYKATNLTPNKVYVLQLYEGGKPSVNSKRSYTNQLCYVCSGASSTSQCTRIKECAPNQRQCETKVRFSSESNRFEISKGCKPATGACIYNSERVALTKTSSYGNVGDLTREQILEIMPALAFFNNLDRILKSPSILQQLEKKMKQGNNGKLKNELQKRCTRQAYDERFCQCCCSSERCNHALLDCGLTDPPKIEKPEPLPPDIATTKSPKSVPTAPPNGHHRRPDPLCVGTNGGCDHVCKAKSRTEVTCDCFDGYTLQEDGKTCEADFMPAVADAGPDITVTLPRESVTISGEGTKGSPKSYKWWSPIAVGKGAGLATSNPTKRDLYVTELKPGTYRFVLTVTGMDGRRSTDMMKLDVLPSSSRPAIEGEEEEEDSREGKTEKFKASVHGQTSFSSVQQRQEWLNYIKENGIKPSPATTTRPRVKISTTRPSFVIIKQTLPSSAPTTSSKPTTSSVAAVSLITETTEATPPPTKTPKRPKTAAVVETTTKVAKETKAVKGKGKKGKGGKGGKGKKLKGKGKVGKTKSVTSKKGKKGKKAKGKKGKLKMAPPKPTKTILTPKPTKAIPTKKSKKTKVAGKKGKKKAGTKGKKAGKGGKKKGKVGKGKKKLAGKTKTSPATSPTKTRKPKTKTSATKATTATKPTTTTEATTTASSTCSPIADFEKRKMTAKCSNDNKKGSSCKFECSGTEVLVGGSSSVSCGESEGVPTWMSGSTPAVLPCCEEACPANALADVIFLIHSTTKIGKAGWTKLMTLTNSITKIFPTGKKNVCYGAMRYNQNVDTTSEMKLNCLLTKKKIKQSLLKMPFSGTGSNTGAAMKYLLRAFKTPANRPEAQDVAVIITDSKSTDDVIKPATALKEAGITVHVITVKTAAGTADPKQMKAVASSRKQHFINLPKVTNIPLPALTLQLKGSICPKPCQRYSVPEDEEALSVLKSG